MQNFLGYLTDLRRSQKILIVGLVDYISITLAIIAALLSNEITIFDQGLDFLLFLSTLPLLTILIFSNLGIYRSVLRYLDLFLIFRLFLGLSISLCFITIFFFIFEDFKFINNKNLHFNLFGWVTGLLVSQLLVSSTRLYANYIFRKRSEKRVVIYGAGSAGIQLASALKVSTEMQPIAFIDRKRSLHNTFLGNLKILPPSSLRKLVAKKKVDEVLIAIPSASKSVLRSLLSEVEQYQIKVRILPGLAEIAQGKILVSELKEVDSSDLMGRLKIDAHQDLIDKNIKGKAILITGAGGSIGSEISRQALINKARMIVLLDSNEYALYAIKKELDEMSSDLKIFAILGNVTDKRRILQVCRSFEIQTVYHAAAYKHVPIVEENPFEAVNNNIFGTKHCLEAACEAKVETFVLISTDKAVRPTNIMGATKRFSELILQAQASISNSQTKMTMVRFGNVIGSSGSAVPLFQKQIKDGGPITVTDPKVIRYFMTIPEAAELVLQAGAMGEGGDVFVLDMGEPIKIVELAKKLVALSGLEVKDENNPNGDIEIVFTGLRPGEKLYEELLIGNNVSKTEHIRILKAKEDYIPYKELEKYFLMIKDAEYNADTAALKNIFKDVIAGFTPDEDIVDVVYLQKQLKS